MDEKLIGYVILKLASIISGKRGKSIIIKILRGSQGKQVLQSVENFSLQELYGILRHIPEDKVEEIIERLMNKNFIYIDKVMIVNYSYPLIFISKEGINLLNVLSKTENQKLDDLRIQSNDIGIGAVSLGENGIKLNDFLLDFFKLTNWIYSKDMTIDMEEINSFCKNTDIDDDNYNKSIEFIKMLESIKDDTPWYDKNNLNKFKSNLDGGLRNFLGSISEKSSATFRMYYDISDEFYKTQDVILSYYNITYNDLQSTHKQTLNKFFMIKWRSRQWFIKSIMKILFGIDDTDEGMANINTEIDTYTQTYNMYIQGMSIKQIAAARGLTESTVFGHFIKLIPKYSLDPFKIIDKERAKKILSIIDESGKHGLSELKELLPDDYDYSEIKLVRELEGLFKELI